MVASARNSRTHIKPIRGGLQLRGQDRRHLSFVRDVQTMISRMISVEYEPQLCIIRGSPEVLILTRA